MTDRSFAALAATGNDAGNWSWTVGLLIRLVLVLALLAADCLGPDGAPDRTSSSGRGVSGYLDRQVSPEGGERMRRARLLPLLVPIALVAASCGQKASVAGSEVAEEVPVATAPGDGGARRDRRRAAADTRHDGSARASTPAAPPDDTEAPSAGPFVPGDGDTNGVTDDEIVIGIHAPVTGASPIPQTSFEIGKDIYWQFLAESAPEQLFRPHVPTTSSSGTTRSTHPGEVQVYREMVEEEGAFMLVGGGGADQITACAQYADENGIPYLSAGVNEDGPRRPGDLLRHDADLRRSRRRC